MKRWTALFALFATSFGAHAAGITVPTFTSSSGVLTLPYLAVDGTVFTDVSVTLGSNGAWQVLSAGSTVSMQYVVTNADGSVTVAVQDASGTVGPKALPYAMPVSSYIANFRGAVEGSIFQLDNGQIWQVKSGTITICTSSTSTTTTTSCTPHYMQGVTIYQSSYSGGYYMTFDGMPDVVEVLPL